MVRASFLISRQKQLRTPLKKVFGFWFVGPWNKKFSYGRTQEVVPSYENNSARSPDEKARTQAGKPKPIWPRNANKINP